MASILALVISTIGATAAGVEPVAPAPSRTVRLSTTPSIRFVGGTADEQQTVIDAVDQFSHAGLSLPDLVIRIHHGKTGCDGSMGRFHPDPSQPSIDLCFDRTFLALHELAHAWERYNVTDDMRSRFSTASGADAWNGSSVPHSHRGIERLADAIAFGLLDEPLSARQASDPKLAQFEMLTGSPSQRLALLASAGPQDPEISAA